MIKVEVAYILPKLQWLIPLELEDASSVEHAIYQSGILEHCPDLDINNMQLGIFSRKVDLGEVLKDGDRVEIYRPLKIDPKQARRNRAKA